MPSEQAVLGLVAQIYDAAGNASLWPAFLENFADAIGSDGSSALVFYDEKGASPALSTVVRSDPYFQDLYARHFSKINPWVAWTRRQTLARNRAISTSEERGSFSEL